MCLVFLFLDCSEGNEGRKERKRRKVKEQKTIFVLLQPVLRISLPPNLLLIFICDGDSWLFLTLLAELAAPFSCSYVTYAYFYLQSRVGNILL